MIILSVIIPVYNASCYIEACVRSLMEQSLRDGLEFIFIDDCSTDNSMFILNQILYDYPNRRPQVRIIHNEKNLGISSVRRLGIELARGSYIGWCDSDDWVEPTMFAKLLETAILSRSDIVVCNYLLEWNNSQKKRSFIPSTTPQQSLKYLYKKGRFSYSLFNQIISKDKLLCACNSKLTPADRGEDLFSLIISYYYSDSIVFIQDYLYHYRQVDNSLSKCFNCSLESFRLQQRNIDYIKSLLDYDNGHYKVACNCITFGNKLGYKSVFSSEKTWFNYHRECHKYILLFSNYPLINRLKTWVVFSSYSCYRLYNFFIGNKN